jgi:hypothetical protein
MSQYNQLQPIFGNQVQSEISDPYSNSFFNTQLAMQRQNVAQSQSSANRALIQRTQSLGGNVNSPLFQQQLMQQQRQGMASNAQGYNNLLLQAGQFRQQALGMAGSYRPLQTGSTNTQTQSGLGTWLPQLAGAAIGAAGMFATGGASGAGSMFKGANGAPNAPTAQMFDTSQAPDIGGGNSPWLNYSPGQSMTGNF